MPCFATNELISLFLQDYLFLSGVDELNFISAPRPFVSDTHARPLISPDFS